MHCRKLFPSCLVARSLMSSNLATSAALCLLEEIHSFDYDTLADAIPHQSTLMTPLSSRENEEEHWIVHRQPSINHASQETNSSASIWHGRVFNEKFAIGTTKQVIFFVSSQHFKSRVDASKTEGQAAHGKSICTLECDLRLILVHDCVIS